MSTNKQSTQDEEFVRLLTEHQFPLRVFIRSLMPGRDEAWDVLQETNAVLWRKKSKFKIGTNFRAWAFKIARYEVLMLLRKEKKRGWQLFDDEMINHIESEMPLDAYELENKQRALETCMQKLKPHDRELIQRRYLEVGSLEDYAQSLNRTAGTLKTRLFRLRAVLRRCITQQLGLFGKLS